MLIKEVMDRTQLSRKAIRYYEDSGLYQTSRSENGYKDYSPENVERLIAVRNLRDLDFSIEEIRDYFVSDDKKAEVLTGKLNDLESKLSLNYKTKSILLSLNDGQAIESVNCDGIKIGENKPYMYIRNIYLVFGVINLISFLAIAIFFLFFVKPGHQEIGLLLLFQLAGISLHSICQSRRRKLKKQGIRVLERKPGEIILDYLLNLLNFAICGAMFNELLFSFMNYIQERSYWGIGCAVLAGFFFLAMAVLLIISGFFDDENDMLKFLARRLGKRKASD